ncbi:MAG: alanine racemase [Bacteriovoracaceae bacterium]
MRFGSELTVHLPRLAHNLYEIKKLSPKADTLLMVKANAYGHGMKEIAEFSYQENGIRDFGCASLGEALFLRKTIPDLNADLYVFSDLSLDQNQSYYSENRLLPVISDLLDLQNFLHSDSLKKTPLTLKFNTGMYRLGFDMSEIPEVINAIKKAGRTSVYHLMTHLSSSGLPIKQNKRSSEQENRFQEIKTQFKASGISIERTSISNSGAIEQGLGVEETHVRPGIMAYGPTSLINTEASTWKGKNISTLKGKILKTFIAERGTPLGYGGTITPERALVVIVGLGYGDGISRAYSGLTKKVHGETGKIFGRVNMDMVSFLFPPTSGKLFKPQEEFVFWDEDANEINRIAEHVGTISYELFCNLSIRLPKIYRLE